MLLDFSVKPVFPVPPLERMNHTAQGISRCSNDNRCHQYYQWQSHHKVLIDFCFSSVFQRAATLIQSFSFPPSCRWEALQVHVGQLRLAFRSLRRADTSLQEAHGCQTLPVRRLLTLLFPIRPPRPAHEEAPELAAFALAPQTHVHSLDTHNVTSCLLRSSFHWHLGSSWRCCHLLKWYHSIINMFFLTYSGIMWSL